MMERMWDVVFEIHEERPKAYYLFYRIRGIEFVSQGWMAKSLLKNCEVDGNKGRAQVTEWVRKNVLMIEKPSNG